MGSHGLLPPQHVLMLVLFSVVISFFFFNDTATTEIYTLSLHDALPILLTSRGVSRKRDKLMKDLGIKGYFTKPYVEELLLDAAQKLITGEKLDSLVWNH